MDVEWMRARIAELYSAPSWKARVAKMPANQIVAIYHNCKRYNTFEKRKKAIKKQVEEPYKQLTLFDVFGYEFASGAVKRSEGPKGNVKHGKEKT